VIVENIPYLHNSPSRQPGRRRGVAADTADPRGAGPPTRLTEARPAVRSPAAFRQPTSAHRTTIQACPGRPATGSDERAWTARRTVKNSAHGWQSRPRPRRQRRGRIFGIASARGERPNLHTARWLDPVQATRWLRSAWRARGLGTRRLDSIGLVVSRSGSRMGAAIRRQLRSDAVGRGDRGRFKRSDVQQRPQAAALLA
jgi:hypothetical protein